MSTRRSSMRRGSFASQNSQSSKVPGSKGISAISKSRGIHLSPMPSISNKKGAAVNIPDETLPHKGTETIKFVYSMAVTKAFKRDYNVTQFGPSSAATLRPLHHIEVARLPEIYNDFRHITELLSSNQRYIEKLRQDLESSGELSPRDRSGKLPLLKGYHNKRRRSRIAMSPMTKFPPII